MIQLTNISKSYHRKLIGHSATHALDNITLSISQGESVAITGPNGSGKSTLLRTILGITKPDSGMVTTSGSIASLIELTAGFHPYLTGRENIMLNGVLQGMSILETKSKLSSILSFSELQSSADIPTKYYSSGMFIRLGFSLAVHVPADIFLIDEVLAVGDSAFQSKCLSRLASLRASGKTILFITHDKALAYSFCTRYITLDNGRIINDTKERNRA